MLNGKVMMILFFYFGFSKPKSLGANIKVELDLSNYATKADLKKMQNIDLASLKSDVDKLDIDKLKNAPNNLRNLKSKVDELDIGKLDTNTADLSKPSDVVKKIAKKTKCVNAVS